MWKPLSPNGTFTLHFFWKTWIDWTKRIGCSWTLILINVIIAIFVRSILVETMIDFFKQCFDFISCFFLKFIICPRQRRIGCPFVQTWPWKTGPSSGPKKKFFKIKEIRFHGFFYLDGTLLNSSSFSSKVGKCLGVMKSSSYSSSSSDQPPPKTESSLSSRINPRLKSSLRSSKKERLLYMSTISVKLKVQNQRKCIDYFRAKYYFHLISLLCCSIFLSGRNRAKFYFFGKFTFFATKINQI